MSKIVISGYYGFANAGDEAMLTAIIKSLRSTEKSVELTVISGDPEMTSAQHQVNSIHRFNFFEIIKSLHPWPITAAQVSTNCHQRGAQR